MVSFGDGDLGCSMANSVFDPRHFLGRSNEHPGIVLAHPGNSSGCSFVDTCIGVCVRKSYTARRYASLRLSPTDAVVGSQGS